MKAAALASSVLAVGVSAIEVIYAPTPYPNPPYNGLQYNSTTYNGVVYNNSREYPCLTEKQYESFIPPCSLNCIDYSLAQDGCDPDDFVCHCTLSKSAIIDSYVIPCLTSGVNATCQPQDIGVLANMVHGSLCPYFEAVGYDAYKQCGGSWGSSSSSSSKTTPSASPTWPTSVAYTTEVVTAYTTYCPGPTTISHGTKTWTVTEATTLTISECPCTLTKPVTTWPSGTWETVNTWPTASTWPTGAPVKSTWAPGAPLSWASSPAGGVATWGGAAAPSGTGAWKATTTYAAQFTGAAVANKVGGAALAGAAAAALFL